MVFAPVLGVILSTTSGLRAYDIVTNLRLTY